LILSRFNRESCADKIDSDSDDSLCFESVRYRKSARNGKEINEFKMELNIIIILIKYYFNQLLLYVELNLQYNI